MKGSNSQVEKLNPTTLQLAEPMGCRFGLSDIRRTAVNIILSPDHKLAAVSDVLGRVLLIDTHRGVVLRMFKGYREAQCSFMQVPDERKSKNKVVDCVALFLVIYSAKKGTVEIFSVQQGSRVSTFTASKFSIFLYINYGLMGFTTTTKSRYVCQYTCLLIDNDGTIKEIIIPFHFALSEKNSKRVRDIHLYKRLMQIIKASDANVEHLTSEALTTCSELKTIEIKLQCLKIFMTCKEVPAAVVLACANYFLKTIETIEGDLDNETKDLKILSQNLQYLLKFYAFVTETDDAIKTDIYNDNHELTETAAKTLFTMAAEQTRNLQMLLDLSMCINNEKLCDLKVSFCDKNDFTVSTFISVFDLTSDLCIFLKESVDDSLIFQVSEVIFKRYIIGLCTDTESLKYQVIESKITTMDLFRMLLLFWVNRPLNVSINLEKEMNHFSQVVYTLAQTANSEEISVEYNSTSKFWSKTRDMLENSSRPFPALTAAIICHSIAQTIELEKEMQLSGTAIDESVEIWEKLTQENCQWTLLIGKLEDVSLLNIILTNKAVNYEKALPKLKHDLDSVSLKYILQKGRGSVSELVACWLTSGGLNPEDIVINDAIYQSICSDGENSSDFTFKLCIGNTEIDESRIKSIKGNQTFEHLNLLKAQFPYSLQANILLSNMCWEYAVAWQKHIEDLTVLEAAMKCLQHIPDPHIIQGLCGMMWNTHLRIIFEGCSKLLNKVGKLPKPRLCQQDTRLSDAQIVTFLEICCGFLDNFMDVLQKCYNMPKTELQYEPIFDSGGQPLAELALQQNSANYDLLQLHYQLGLTLLMMASLEIKYNKPINHLFSNSVISVLFTDVCKKPKVSLNTTDSKIISSQTHFLFKVINASIETITVKDNVLYTNEHVHWTARCESLARVWNIDVDLLKQHQIIQLFSSGFDSLAEELLPAVANRNLLGPGLFTIAGRRLIQHIDSSTDLGKSFSALSPVLTNYLKTLVSSL